MDIVSLIAFQASRWYVEKNKVILIESLKSR